MDAAIRAEQLVKRYDGMSRNAVDGLSFTVRPGGIVGLLGPNGAGKTTLTKLMCGVTGPTSGRITVLGADPFGGTGPEKRATAVVHQSAPFDMMLSARDNLKIAAGFRGLRWRDARPRADRLIEAFGLADRMPQLAFTLSGGEKRRLQIVRALLDVPRLLLLDEPSAGLDVTGRRQVWSLINDLRMEHGTTILWTSHYIEELERNCDRVLIIDRGRLVRYATPRDLVGQLGGRVVTLTPVQPEEAARLAAIAGATGATATVTAHQVEISGPDVDERLPGVLGALHDHGVRVGAIEFRSPSLEDAFVTLTGGTG